MNTTDMHIPSNRVRDIERYVHTELAGRYPDGELRMFVYMLFEAFLGWDKTQLLLHRDDTINQSDLLRFHWAVEDLKQFRPIQHIIGHTDFCGLRIRVTPDVLVPRPETEEIVARLTDWLASRQAGHPAILDLCTGSGCIAIALKHRFPSAQVTAVDISPAALTIARDNAAANHTDIHFVEVDVLYSMQLDALSSSYDLIVSNPPYVMEHERANMQPNVLNYDPALALFVPDSDPLRFYRAIGQYAATHLAPQGLLALEINQALPAETAQLLQALGFDTQLHHDFRSNPRCITASLPSCNTKE
jgi:release factor glutamine methyltransferase